ncbi:MFS transporter [Falsiroseomonas sp. HW251]|uniref:MFS transporter n=1 Tax=Falsiroseomonas sp. HW251 TaxID=3390998 RepID=UPI003D316F9E
MLVSLTFLYVLCSSATLGIPGVLLVPMAEDLGWSVGDISAPIGVRFALFGLIAPFAGALLVRYGPRAVVAASAALLLVGLLMAMTITTRWQLWLSLGVLCGIAPGMTAVVLPATVATRWFTARRGLVLGLLGGGGAAGQLVFLPPVAWIAEAWGWRYALLPSAISVGILAALFWLLARDRPQEIGLAPYGETGPPAHPAALSSGNPFALSLSALAEGVRTPLFWLLAFTFAVCGLSSTGLMQAHFVPLCGDYGIATLTAAGLLGVIGAFNMAGTIASGWLSDRYDPRWLLMGYYGFRGVSLVWLPFSDFSIMELSLFSVLFGLDFIATVPPTVKLAVQALGREKAPIAFGWIFAAHQLGAGAMAYVAGESRDVLGTYLPAFFTAGLLCFVAALCFVAVRGRPRPITAAA